MCGSIVQTPLCEFHYASSFVRIPSFPSSAFHRAPSIERIPSSVFHLAYSIKRSPSRVRMRMLSCRFIERIPSCRFHRANSIVRIRSCGFDRSDSIVRIPSYVFHCINSIQNATVCILLFAFRCVHFVLSRMYIPSCNRRRKEEVKEDGGWVHWRIVFKFAFALPLASTGMHQQRSY